jgi:putative peptidoglycan lipid II flippase
MWRFLKNRAKIIFNKKQEDILSAAFVISVSVAASRILGLFRYRLLASYFGNDLKLLDSYVAASAVPDAIFEVLIFGAIALAFIPIFSKYLSKEKMEKAWAFSSTMITIGLVLFAIFAVLVMIFAGNIAPLIAPGLVAKQPETQIIIARLLRIMILAQLFFVISIFITGVLQSFQRFLVPALASVFYNVGIILAIIFLAPVIGIYSAAVGMIIGALLHLVIQLPLALSLGFKFKPNLNFKNDDVRETFSLMWPRSLAIGLSRLSDLVNIALVSIAAVGSIVSFNFAQVLQIAPIAFFATPIAQAALPSLSIQFNEEKKEEFKKLFLDSFHQILFLILPASAILAILRIPTVRLVFGAKQLPWDITVLTGRVLVAFSFGIAASAMSILITRGFHAARDSMTPVKVNLSTVAVNIVLSLTFVFVFHLSIIWLAVSYSFTNILNFLALLYLLDKKVGGFAKGELIAPTLKMLFITILMAISLYVPMKLLDQLVFDTTKVVGLLTLTIIAGVVGLFVYGLLSWVFKVKELEIYAIFLKRVISWPLKLATPDPTSIDAQEKNPS